MCRGSIFNKNILKIWKSHDGDSVLNVWTVDSCVVVACQLYLCSSVTWTKLLELTTIAFNLKTYI